MFKSDKLIYIQMQKTGCTHITLLLSSLFDGEQIGKHRTATLEQIEKAFVISSIRNPWEWYLSLWTFGVQGKGGLRMRLTQKRLFFYIIQTLKNPKTYYRSFLNELAKDVSLWRNVYDKNDNVESFRKWLKLLHEPSNGRFLGEGYGRMEIPTVCGFMTYRYLKLCCLNSIELVNPRLVSNHADLVQFERKNCYINYFIRQESLEDDLCEAIEKVRPLTLEEREFIYGAKKTNSSIRSLLISDYYDQESIDLIHRRDSLLIDKFCYSPPK